MSKITPFLWFDTQLDEAVEFYKSVFKDFKLIDKTTYPEGSPAPAGSLMAATFVLNGQEFMGLNAGPNFTFTEAISFFISCADQTEVDYYWEALLAGGGEASQCGWLKDKFGLSWQVVPTQLMQLMSDADSKRAGKTMQAMLKMQKINIAELEAAANS